MSQQEDQSFSSTRSTSSCSTTSTTTSASTSRRTGGIPKMFLCKFDPYNVHLFRKPTVLPCGNTACYECIENSLINSTIQCNFDKCKCKHEIKDVKALIQNIMIDDALGDSINSIAKYVYHELKEKYVQYKGSLSEKRTSITNFFNFIEEEILIRIESIKISFDNLQTELIDHIRHLRTDYETNLENEFIAINKQIQQIRKSDSEQINKDSEQIKRQINKCQDIIKEFENMDLKIAQKLRTITFEPNEWIPQLDMIGKISIAKYLNLNYLKKIKPTVIDLSKSLKSLNRIYNLNDEVLIATSADDNSIVFFNECFQEIRKITEIDGYKFKAPLSVCSDKENKYLYCCDFGNHKVIILDYVESKVKKIIGKHGCEPSEFIEPLDLAFHTDKLYVLESGNKRVQTFTQEGEYINEIKLYATSKSVKPAEADDKSYLSHPNRLGVNDNFVCVLDSFRKVYIYSKTDGDLKQIIKSTTSTLMSLIDNYLFTCDRDGLLLCYQQRTKDSKYVQTFDRIVSTLKVSKSYMAFYRSHLIVSLTDSRSIVHF